MKSFTKKQIRVTFRLAAGEFSSGGNTVAIEGLPVSARITKQGGDAKDKCNIEIQNVILRTANELTSLAFKRRETRNNIIEVFAGSAGTELSLAFQGEVSSCFPAISDDGTLSVKAEALAGYYPSLVPAAPLSVGAPQSVDSLFSQFAREIGYAYENRGVTGEVSNIILTGSPIAKARTLARQAGVDLIISDGRFRVQPYSAPKYGQIPLISAATGLLGYPSYGSDGLHIRTIYNPLVEIGRYVKVESVLPHATGEWQVVKIDHKIDANLPSGGSWETEITAVLP